MQAVFDAGALRHAEIGAFADDLGADLRAVMRIASLALSPASRLLSPEART
jgi:hypothetical protein